jgi:sterol desaturase/sphingolipid hydroxylase (fatty acid hydroxylase superfamily)
VIHFFWDRILGTYRRPDARFRGQKGFPNQLVSVQNRISSPDATLNQTPLGSPSMECLKS